MTLELLPPFGEGMVLQRGREVRLRGRAKPGARLCLCLGPQRLAARANEAGLWSASLPPHQAGGPFALEIDAGEERLALRQVWFGDVWLCAGQSNMQLPVRRVRGMFPEEPEEGRCPGVSQFTVPPAHSLQGPGAQLFGGQWQAAQQGIEDFSAVGYFFGKALYGRYGVPIGLLAAAVGGTPVHTWLSREMLAAMPQALEEVDKWTESGLEQNRAEADARDLQEYYAALNEADKGLAEGWQAPEYDDSQWPRRLLDKPWEEELTAPGTVWFRKTVSVPPELAGRPAMLYLGTLTDADEAFVNGEPVGNTTYRYPPRQYAVKALPKGRCTLAIRVIHSGEGGFTPDKFRMLSCGGRTLDLNTEWSYRRGAFAPACKAPLNFANLPTASYNAMIAPLHGYPIKGVIWYQGETDTTRPEGYADKMAALIRGWRQRWGEDFPFLMSQLAYFRSDEDSEGWAALRREQVKCLGLPGTALVYAIDAGEYNDLHPLNKKLVGERLARAAMQLAYGEELPPTPFQLGPLF